MQNQTLDFDELKRLSIIEVGRDLYNLTPKKLSSNCWSFEEHDSIRISADINIFKRFSVMNAGGSVIDFVIEMQKEYYNEKISLLQAAYKLKEYKENGAVLGSYGEVKKREFKSVSVLPDYADNMKKVFGYLCSSRRIDYQLVKEMAKKKFLYQDTYGNCVFVGYFNGDPYYSTKVGTNPDKKAKFDVEGSFKEVGMYIDNNSTTLKVFESPIDALSYMSLRKLKQMPYNDADYLVLSGASVIVSALRFNLQKRNKEFEYISLCLDNDEAGLLAMDEARDYLNTNYENIKHDINVSVRKDWNDDLKAIYHQSKISDEANENTDEIEGNYQYG